MLVGILPVFFLLVFSGLGGCVGNHTLFCLMLSFFCHAGLVGCVCGGESSTSFNLFVCFFSNF